MRLSTNTRYAVTCIVDLAINENGSKVRLASIAQRQSISVAYLEQIFAKLRRAGIVLATRGPGGGYSLAKPVTELSVLDIMQAVDEGVDTTGCNGKMNCRSGDKCLTHDLWSSLNSQIFSFLQGVTLHKLLPEDSSNNTERRIS